MDIDHEQNTTISKHWFSFQTAENNIEFTFGNYVNIVISKSDHVNTISTC